MDVRRKLGGLHGRLTDELTVLDVCPKRKCGLGAPRAESLGNARKHPAPALQTGVLLFLKQQVGDFRQLSRRSVWCRPFS